MWRLFVKLRCLCKNLRYDIHGERFRLGQNCDALRDGFVSRGNVQFFCGYWGAYCLNTGSDFGFDRIRVKSFIRKKRCMRNESASVDCERSAYMPTPPSMVVTMPTILLRLIPNSNSVEASRYPPRVAEYSTRSATNWAA